jgi:hypothetical protein
VLIPKERLTATDLYRMIDWFREAWDRDPVIAQSSYRPGQLHEEGGYALERLRVNLRQLPETHRRRCLILLGQWLVGEVTPTEAFTQLRLAVHQWDASQKEAA